MVLISIIMYIYLYVKSKYVKVHWCVYILQSYIYTWMSS